MERTARQQEVLELAQRLFSTQGYGATSMRDLADAAGVLPGSLYAHFRSKAEILGAIVEDFYAELLPVQEAAATSGGSGSDRFGRMVDAILPVLARRPHELLVVSAEWSSLLTDPSLGDAAASAARSFQIWTEVVHDGQQDGSVRTDVDVEMLVSMTTFALVGVVRCMLSKPGSMPIEGASTVIRGMAGVLPDASTVA